MKLALLGSVGLLWLVTTLIAGRLLKAPLAWLVEAVDAHFDPCFSAGVREVLEEFSGWFVGIALGIVTFLSFHGKVESLIEPPVDRLVSSTFRKLNIPVSRQIADASFASAKCFNGAEVCTHTIQQRGSRFEVVTETFTAPRGERTLVRKQCAFQNSDVEPVEKFKISRYAAAGAARLGWVIRIPFKRNIPCQKTTLTARSSTAPDSVEEFIGYVELVYLLREEADLAERQFQKAVGYQ